MDILTLITAFADAMLSPSTQGWLAWIGLGLTLIGLIKVYFQAKDAKTAAATAQAGVEALELRLEAVNLAYASAQLNVILHSVRHGEFALAQTLLVPMKRAIRLKLHERQHIERARVNRMIAAIDRQLELGLAGDPKYKAQLAFRAIDGLLSQVTAWESAAATAAREIKE